MEISRLEQKRVRGRSTALLSQTALFSILSLLPFDQITSPPLRAVDPISEAAIDLFRGNCKCRSIFWNFHLVFNFPQNTPPKIALKEPYRRISGKYEYFIVQK